MNTKSPTARFCMLVMLVFTFAFTAFAQSQATTGNIEGTVVDPNGAVVPNVTVTATNMETGFAKTAQTNDEGTFVLPYLQPGNYKVTTVAVSGFGAATYENVSVTVGAKTTLQVVLTASGTANVVNVEGQGEGVETTRTSVSSTVSERRVINLPTNGRNFLDFVTLTPGIVRDPTRSGDLAVGGQKGTLNSLQIDGTSSDNTFFGQASGRTGSGRAPSQFSIDTVREFQVNQNGFSAEFGRAAGAVINVVTKSGTNRFSGSVFEYFRDESLNARSPNLVAVNRPRPAGQINQFGGTVGGPIKEDKAFFFGAYEGQRSNLPNPVVVRSLPFAPASVQTLLTPKTASYNIDRIQDTFLVKTDFNLNDKNQLWIRFNQQNFTGTNLESSGTLSALEHTGNSNVKTSTFSTAWTSTIASNLINEFRFQYSRDQEPGLSNTTDPETTVVANAGGINDGTFAFGRNNFSPRETTIKRYQFIDNQIYLVGNHSVKYGADLLFDRIFNFFPGLFSGSYTFPSYAALAARTPSRYRQSFAGAGTTGGTTFPNNSEYGFFVQDDWRATHKLTLNLGLRYDYQAIAKPPISNPNPVLVAAGFDTGFQPKDKNNFAPRLGVAYSFDPTTVVRAAVWSLLRTYPIDCYRNGPLAKRNSGSRHRHKLYDVTGSLPDIPERFLRHSDQRRCGYAESLSVFSRLPTALHAAIPFSVRTRSICQYEFFRTVSNLSRQQFDAHQKRKPACAGFCDVSDFQRHDGDRRDSDGPKISGSAAHPTIPAHQLV